MWKVSTGVGSGGLSIGIIELFFQIKGVYEDRSWDHPWNCFLVDQNIKYKIWGPNKYNCCNCCSGIWVLKCRWPRKKSKKVVGRLARFKYEFFPKPQWAKWIHVLCRNFGKHRKIEENFEHHNCDIFFEYLPGVSNVKIMWKVLNGSLP